MATVEKQILSGDEAITGFISRLSDDRGLLSQAVLNSLRDLVEGVAVLLQYKDLQREFVYAETKDALAYVKSQAKLNYLGKFHGFLAQSMSHFSRDGDTSERLMLKYYEYLFRMRALLRDRFEMEILASLESFPIRRDPSLKGYYRKIAERIQASVGPWPGRDVRGDMFYIQQVRPFFVDQDVYYEVTFRPISERLSKTDRLIAFTSLDVSSHYAAEFVLHQNHIDTFGQVMPVTIITSWRTSIRPCEFDNFGRILGLYPKIGRRLAEYRELMTWLTQGSRNLVELLTATEGEYQQIRATCLAHDQEPRIFAMLDKARSVIVQNQPGSNLLRYLLLEMNNQLIKDQRDPKPCTRLSNLNLKLSCIPFDDMPLCSSPVGHNPKIKDLIESIEVSDRDHELLARRVKDNVESRGMLYTPVNDLGNADDVEALATKYNSRLYSGHRPRRDLVIDKSHAFIQEYEDDTVSIMSRLADLARSGVENYSRDVAAWLQDSGYEIDDPRKIEALKALFSQSRVAVINGAAGTGKSTMVNYIAAYFSNGPDQRCGWKSQTPRDLPMALLVPDHPEPPEIVLFDQQRVRSLGH